MRRRHRCRRGRRPPPAAAPAQAPPGVPGSIRSQPLPPPPGSVANAPGTGPTVAPIGPPGTGGAGQMKPPAPANTAPQPGDEVVMEMPAVKIQNPTAVFSGLDKITGRIIAFDVKLNETVQFGALQVTPRVCYTRPATEAANIDGFVEVDEVTLQGEVKRIFTGWMFASSPGLHAVEHPIYDVWLTSCKGGTTVVADTQPGAQGATQSRRRARQKRRHRHSSVHRRAGGSSAGATAAATAPAQRGSASKPAAVQQRRTSCSRCHHLRARPRCSGRLEDRRRVDNASYLPSVAASVAGSPTASFSASAPDIGRSTGSAAKSASPISASARSL